MKKIAFVMLILTLVFSSVSITTLTVSAADRYYAGEYKKKIGKKTYYFSMNQSTGEDNSGCFYLFNSKSNCNKFKYCKMGTFKRVKKNVYRYKTKKGSLTFTIGNKKMTVKQTGTVVKGVKLNGVFKLTKLYEAP
jgi:hypothetical protein